MADNRNTTLPRWAYLLLALACMAMGLWASYITLEYFEHGAKALETDKALQALAVSAAVMFVASEMAAFALAALLTERQLKARRWSLTGFAAAVLALEVFTIVAVQLALTSGADLAQTTVQTQEKDLRARIALIEADAAAKRATADQQRATAKTAYELHLAGKSSDKAAAEQAKTGPLYDELAKVQAQKRPTLVGLLGEKTALAYAVARGVLVSLGGLVFFGVAGALLRTARGGALSVDTQLLALLTELRDRPGTLGTLAAPGAPAAPAQAVALAAPAPTPAAPAPASFKPSGTVAPAGVPTGLTYSGKAMLAGAGALAAVAAPMAVHAAPHAPAAPAAGALQPSHLNAPAAVAEPVNVDTPTHGTPVNVDTLTHDTPVNVDTPARSARQRAARGEIMDSGTGEHDGHRYRRALELVKSGAIRPSQGGIYQGVRASRPVAERFLDAMHKAGEIVPNPEGQGWVLARKEGAQ